MSNVSASRQDIDVVPLAPASQPGSVRTDRSTTAGRALIAAPDRIVSSFLAACIPVGLAVIFHVFVPVVVIPAVVIAVAALWRWSPSQYLELRWMRPWWHPRTVSRTATAARSAPSDPDGVRSAQLARLGAALALLLVIGWLWVNRQHVSAYVVLTRDPDIYTLRALWLVHHNSPLIDSAKEALDAGGVPGVGLDSLAFPRVGTTLYPQSNALLPGLLAVLGWVLNIRGVMIGNLLIGAVGLLAVYGFARRLLGPIWALLPMVTLAACMPMVAFSRGTYSEPVALVATFGGLTLLWIAWQTGHLGQFFVAGLFFGVSSLARIDGGVTLIGVLAGFAVVTLGARNRHVRTRAALACTAWAVAAGVLDGASLIDGKINSPIYQTSEWHGIFPLLVGTVVAYLVTVGVAFVPLGRLRTALAGGGERWARWVLGIALVIGIVMVSRPLWWTSRTPNLLAPSLGAMQKGLGLPVDPTRTYDESSLNWMAMYLGWPVIVLAGIGAALLLSRTVRRRDPRLAAFVMVIGCVAALYLNKIAIFADQIWAMRRFLPVVLPGLLIAGVYPLARLSQVPRLARFRRPAALVGAVLGAVVVLGPLLVWNSSNLWGVGNRQAQEAEVQDLCTAVGDHPVILAGPQPGSAAFLPTFKAVCGSEVITYVAPSPTGLATLRQHFVDPGLGPDTDEPLVVTFSPKSVQWVGGKAPAPYLTSTVTGWNQPLQHIPDQKTVGKRSVWIGTLNPAGQVLPVSQGPTILNGP